MLAAAGRLPQATAASRLGTRRRAVVMRACMPGRGLRPSSCSPRPPVDGARPKDGVYQARGQSPWSTDAVPAGQGAPPMTDAANLLGQQTSPYLLQHAENPVHWRPWGQDALAEAAAAGKPILLSIGYAACHWCHVMAHESFEDPDTAALMNERFVNIKIDREKRPETDHSD